VNPNAIADEEEWKAWLDDESAMPFHPNGFKFARNVGVAPAPGATADRYRPISYPIEIVDPTYTGGTPQLVKALGWSNGFGELLDSGTLDETSNKSFVNSTDAGGNPLFIDFGGEFSTAGAVQKSQRVSAGDLSLAGQSYSKLVNDQFPGIANGPTGFNAGVGVYNALYPGWDREFQVSSEFFKMFLISRSGRDCLWGTADDKPFHGFGSAYLSDTLLRQRNYAHLDEMNDARFGSTASPSTYWSNMSGVSNTGAPGEYITRLGGQWTPRLFDPVPLPYNLDNNPTATTAIGPTNTLTMAFRADVPAAPGGGPPNGVEYWTQEWRRNEILSKIAANTTSRSNVFGVWITVGYFRVEPGTENLLVPLLHEEVGSTTGTQKRHRMFAIVDRTQAKQFTELMTTNPPKLEDNAVVRHYSFIE